MHTRGRAAGPRRWLALVVWLALVTVGGACVDHPVGPARTYSAYEGKAVNSAEAALSAVQTAKLTADSAAAGNAFGPYAGVVLSESETSLVGVQGTFLSIQPPNGRADALARDLNGMLSKAADHLVALRVAARRGELAELGRLAESLVDDPAALETFVKEHG
jgi:hypothetical protein